jgi:hypothetical protein
MRASSATVVTLFFLFFPACSELRAEEFGWAGRLGGSQVDRAEAAAVAPGGAIVVVGSFQGSADFDPGPGSVILDSAGMDDAFVVKLDSVGSLVWARRLGSSSLDDAHDVAVDGDGNVWVVGEFEGTVDFDPGPGSFPLTASWHDAFIWKLDGNGAFLWAGRVGGSSGDVARAVTLGSFGAVYVTGTFVQTADFDPGPGVFNLTSAGSEDVFLLRLNSEGIFGWARRMGGPSYDWPFGIAVDGEQRVWTVGRFAGTADFDPGSGTYELTAIGLNDGFVSTVDGAGSFVSAGRIGGSGNDRFDGVASDGAQGLFVIGTFQGTADLAPGDKTDERISAGGYDVFVSALGADGESLWTATLGAEQDDHGWGIAADGGGHVLAVGKVQGTADFDPGDGTFPLAASFYDGFVWKLDTAGEFRWAGLVGGASDDGARGVVAFDGGGVGVVGDFFYTADFDPGPGVYSLSPAGSYDAFVLRLDRCGTFADASPYGRLVFAPMCTTDARDLPGNPGSPQTYGTAVIGVHRNAADRVFLSSCAERFAPLIVDDEIHVNGIDAGLGPYDLRPGVPPFLYDVPIDRNLVPDSPREVTSLIPPGTSEVVFEAVDVDRAVLGRTPVYVVQDCGLIVEGRGPTALRFVSHDDDVLGTPPDFDVRVGLLSELRSDGGFARATCLGRFLSSPAQDPLPDPPSADGRYYLARALAAVNACEARGYGEAEGLDPDPRGVLDAMAACP